MNFEDLPEWRQLELLQESYKYSATIGGKRVYADPRTFEYPSIEILERFWHWLVAG